MSFLERAIKRGISRGVSQAVGKAVRTAVEPKATELANKTAEGLIRHQIIKQFKAPPADLRVQWQILSVQRKDM